MGSNGTLLLIGEDPVLRRALKDQLVAMDFVATVDEADSSTDGVTKAKTRSFDVILLDTDLFEDGRAACHALRAVGAHAPIIMLTGAERRDEIAIARDDDATHYIAKPFRMATLLARVQAHLQQNALAGEASFTIGPYTFQPAAKLLIADGRDQKIRLTEKETAILTYLYRMGNTTVPRETLLDEVWGYNEGVTTHTLETHIYRLRQKIEPDPQQIQLLMTEPGGYRLNP
jgi:DNA-binding response OmpR family regulator